VSAASSSTTAVAISSNTEPKPTLSQRSGSRQAPPATRVTCQAATGATAEIAMAMRGCRPK
jgi:hypothetical protein